MENRTYIIQTELKIIADKLNDEFRKTIDAEIDKNFAIHSEGEKAILTIKIIDMITDRLQGRVK